MEYENFNDFCYPYIDDLTKEQINNCLKHPAYRKGALMPDAHGGYDAPIGSVIGLKDWVVPSWIGYDIGCGMCAIQTDVSFDEFKKGNDFKELHKKIHEAVPCGSSKHQQAADSLPTIHKGSPAIREAFEKRDVMLQFGTLGGGNHFIEVGKSTQDDTIWLVVHSGSRGLGHAVTGYWIAKQKEETSNLGWWTESKEGEMYISDMNQCLSYALWSRKLILDLTAKAIGVNLKMDTIINRNHNHMDQAHGLCIHRKGATHSEEGMLGVIPGNMRDGSYIVKGLGNPDSLWSSSHGAGRKMSRSKAKEKLNLSDFETTMKGIVGDVKEKTLDEAPDAYKDISEVIRVQEEAGILEVLDVITPIINIKG